MLRRLLLVSLSIPLLSADADSALTTDRVAFGLTRPVYVTAPDGDPDRLFIVEQAGVIKILQGNLVHPRPFLDIQTIVDDSLNEQGLLGLTFDPDYDTNGYFYVYFTHDPGPGSDLSRIRRFTVSADPDSADVNSGFEIFRWPQYSWNHNGGQLDFGP
ncbi:MAG TPA: PQQ-dependent sugar dehydrogenase, partial [bacterium]|nr:PQQ-dependent sugar dehydrogenase [bacterium]